MAEARAVAKFVRVSPFKARRVVALIRGKPVEEALAILKFSPQRAAGVVSKVVASAAANAVQNEDATREKLVVHSVLVDQGPAFRRMRGATRFPAIIRRPLSHITVVVSDAPALKAPRMRTRGAR